MKQVAMDIPDGILTKKPAVPVKKALLAAAVCTFAAFSCVGMYYYGKVVGSVGMLVYVKKMSPEAYAMFEATIK